MNPMLVGGLGIILLLVLLLARVHLAVALATCGFLGLWAIMGFGAAMISLATSPFWSLFSYDFVVIPLFLIMGMFVVHSGLGTSLFEASHKLSGKLPGALAVATTLGNAAFGSVSGSSVAAAALFTKLGLNEMINRGYDKRLASGCIAAAGGLAALIPPSAMMVLYALFAERSISKCLMAGLIPGFITAIALVIATIAWVKVNPKIAPHTETRVSWLERWHAVRSCWPFLVLVVVIWGGIYTGVVTVTESSGIGAFVAFITMLIYRKRASWKYVKEASSDVAKTVAMLFLIVVGALLFSHFMAASLLPQRFANLLSALQVSRYVILLGFFVMYLVLGCFLEGIGMMTITLPVVLPVLQALGFDLIWFGVIFVLLVEIGFITPPVGMNVFVVKATAGDIIELHHVFRGVVPYLFSYASVVALFTIFPSIVLLIPSLMD